jgi:hypothetical protein
MLSSFQSPDTNSSSSSDSGNTSALAVSEGESDASSWPNEPARFDDLEKPWNKPSTEELKDVIGRIFDENITAKVIRTANMSLKEDESLGKRTLRPTAYPEIVPQSGPDSGIYEFREPEFWTCGFFPGTLHALLERSTKHPNATRFVSRPSPISHQALHADLTRLCKIWSAPLHDMANRTDTHDIGFIIMPALRRVWELRGDQRSLQSIITAANSLATRYIHSAGAIRSWDSIIRKDFQITDSTNNILVIIDSMCNLDLMFYASEHSGNNELAQIAETHARTLLRTHLREESIEIDHKNGHTRGYRGQLYSTCHVANVHPATGELLWRRTHQGYSNESTWARGQAWAILGYAQTYLWTKDSVFLDAACGAAEYFIYRLNTSPSCVEMPVGDVVDGRTKGRYVPLWDFDAPIDDPTEPLRDSSAGVIAANGMLVLSQSLMGCGQHRLGRWFFQHAILIIRDTLNFCHGDENAKLVWNAEKTELRGEDVENGKRFDGLLKNGTANNNEFVRRRYSNHGLVYGDYYLVEFGNRLLDMGFV